MNENNPPKFQLTGFDIKIMAMLYMLCDHIEATLSTGQEWLTVLGRLAFPMFAFLLAEGYAHTKDVKAYMKRLLIWAIISEIPFNLMYGGSVIYPWHQNVLWTFLIAILVLELTRKAATSPIKAMAAFIIISALGFILGFVTMADYYGIGVLTVILFYATRGPGIRNKILQLAGIYILNVNLLGGYCYAIDVFTTTLELPQQGFALFALPIIWLYNGERGRDSKTLRTAFYAFYPAHITILLIINTILFKLR